MPNPRGRSTPRQRSGPRGHRFRTGAHPWWFILGAAGLTAVVAGLILAWYLARGVDRIRVAAPGSGGGGSTFVIVGSDTRAFVHDAGTAGHWGSPAQVPGERADMIAVVRIPADGPARVLQIPRDLLVEVQGFGQQRIGLTLTKGPQLLVDTVCSSLGVGADHLVIVDFRAFRRLVESAGSISVTTDTPIRDAVSGLDLERAGRHDLDADQALAFARARQAEIRDATGRWVPEPDASERRVERLQQAMAALGAARGTFSGPVGLLRVARAARGTTRVDRSMGVSDILRLRTAITGLTDPSRQDTLAARFSTGIVPTATATADARGQLEAIGAGRTSRCRVPSDLGRG